MICSDLKCRWCILLFYFMVCPEMSFYVISLCLKEAQENGELNKKDDHKQMAAFILNSWHGAMLRMKTTSNSKPLEDCKAMIMNKILG